MSFTYVITETEKELLTDVECLEEITSIEEKVYSYNNEMISYIELKKIILSPEKYEGRVERETFYTGHSDLKKAHDAKWRFSEVCKIMTGLRTGEAIETGQLVGKKMLTAYKTNVSEKTGKTYQNIVSRVLVSSSPEETKAPLTPTGEAYDAEKTAAVLALAGIQLPTTPQADSKPLNDEVPF